MSYSIIARSEPEISTPIKPSVIVFTEPDHDELHARVIAENAGYYDLTGENPVDLPPFDLSAGMDSF